jgi:hypothetical protein
MVILTTTTKTTAMIAMHMALGTALGPATGNAGDNFLRDLDMPGQGGGFVPSKS